MMHFDLTSRPHHYAALILVQAGLMSVFFTAHDPFMKIATAIGVGVAYALWGILTHAKDRSPVRLVLEYCLVGLLGTLILLFLIQEL